MGRVMNLPIAVSTGTITLAVSVILVVAAGVLAAVAGRQYRRTAALRSREAWEQQVHEVCGEAQTVVDLTAVEDLVAQSPSRLTSIQAHLSKLERTSRRLSGRATDPRVVEAIEDVRRVAVSLEAALAAERSLRAEGVQNTAAQRIGSSDRIAKRAAELKAAADELLWQVE